MSRLELFTELAGLGGTRLTTGGFVRDVSAMTSLRSIDPSTTEALSFTIPRSSESANVLAENQVARLWKSDSDFDEYRIAQYTITRGTGGSIAVTAPAPWLALAYAGAITQPGLDPLDGVPIYEFQVSGTPQELIEQLITNRSPADDLAARLAWLGSGTYDVTTTIALDVSYWSALQTINAIIDALADAHVLAERKFRRNGTSGYLVDILAVNA